MLTQVPKLPKSLPPQRNFTRTGWWKVLKAMMRKHGETPSQRIPNLSAREMRNCVGVRLNQGWAFPTRDQWEDEQC